MGKLSSSVAFLASSGGPRESKVLVFVESHFLVSPQLPLGEGLEGPRLPLSNPAACFQCSFLQLHMEYLFHFTFVEEICVKGTACKKSGSSTNCRRGGEVWPSHCSFVLNNFLANEFSPFLSTVKCYLNAALLHGAF